MPSPNEYRALEESARTSVASRAGGSSVFTRILLPVVGLFIAGWIVWVAIQPHQRVALTTPDKEDFRSAQYPAPTLDAHREPKPDQNTIYVPPAPEPPPPPPQPPTTIAAPPPVQVPDALPPPRAATDNSDEEARRREEEEERRKWERLRAGQVITDSSNSADGKAKGYGPDGTADTSNTEDDPNRRFLSRTTQAGVDLAEATQNKRTDALVAQGTMIKGVLETAIQSDLAGMVRAVVAEDVWSFDGRRVLIPAGSRLIGEYKSGLKTGQTRVFIVWTRMLRSDGVSVQLGSIGTDELGRTGMTGEIDQHFVEKFGSTIMLSIVGGASQFIGNLGNNQGGYAGGGYGGYGGYGVYGGLSTDPATGQVLPLPRPPNQYLFNAQQIGAQQISQTMTRIAEEALKDSIQIPPTIHVDQGSQIVVFVRRDLDFSAFYEDPVKEALREIRRERAANRLPH